MIPYNIKCHTNEIKDKSLQLWGLFLKLECTNYLLQLDAAILFQNLTPIPYRISPLLYILFPVNFVGALSTIANMMILLENFVF